MSVSVRLAVTAVVATNGRLDQAQAVIQSLAWVDGQEHVAGMQPRRWNREPGGCSLWPPKMPPHGLANECTELVFIHWIWDPALIPSVPRR